MWGFMKSLVLFLINFPKLYLLPMEQLGFGIGQVLSTLMVFKFLIFPMRMSRLGNRRIVFIKTKLFVYNGVSMIKIYCLITKLTN